MADGLRKGLTSYGDAGFSLFLRKAFIKAMGYSDDALNRPIVGITNTYSDYNPCHGNVPALVEAVKRGVMLAMMDGRIRACTHLDVTAEMIEEAVGHVRDIVRAA